jgi:DtxR family Mn-dependent transcriptional regulator
MTLLIAKQAPVAPVDPALALLVAIALGVLAALAFWPRSGLWARLASGLRSRERILVEDALKHLHDFEAREQPATLESLAGALGLTGNQTTELLARLERLELVDREGQNLRLTGEGRSDALRVIRIHRLWERYLAEETGFAPSEWHRTAEVLEHETSEERAQRLGSDLGEPRFDPHGDPIPTAEGEIVSHGGRPLTELPVGRIGEIVHLEDEPDAIYAQLVAEGLQPGTRVRVLEHTPERVRFEADAEEVVLAPVLAANVSVAALGDGAAMRGPFVRLTSLAVGDSARIVGLAPACRGKERRRLLDLGLVPGTVVTAELKSPGGDPVAYRVRGAVIALRSEQTDLIQVEPPEVEAAAAARKAS